MYSLEGGRQNTASLVEYLHVTAYVSIASLRDGAHLQIKHIVTIQYDCETGFTEPT